MAVALEARRTGSPAPLRQRARLPRRQRLAPGPQRGWSAATPTCRRGGYRQFQEAGGHVRKGEKGTPIMYVGFGQRRTARDEQGKPIQDEEGRPKLEGVQWDRSLVKLHHVFNVEQTEGLELRPLQNAPGPEQEGHERAEALIGAAGPQITRGPAEVLPELTFVLEAGAGCRVRDSDDSPAEPGVTEPDSEPA